MAFIQQFKVLTFADTFDPSKIVFDKPRDEEVGGNKHIKGKRIKIGYMTNGKVSELIIPTEKLHAYKGVRPTKPFGREDSDEIIGYNLPISLYSRNGDADGRDRRFVEVFRQIIDAAKDYVISVKKQIGQSHLEKVMLYKWDNMLYEKKNEDGQPMNDFGPTLFAKLLYSREKNAISTRLVSFSGKPLRLDEVLLKPADVIASVKFESIYVNSNGCSLQVKITEALMDVKAPEAVESLLLKAFIVPTAEEVSTTAHQSPGAVSYTPAAATASDSDEMIQGDTPNISESDDDDDNDGDASDPAPGPPEEELTTVDDDALVTTSAVTKRGGKPAARKRAAPIR